MPKVTEADLPETLVNLLKKIASEKGFSSHQLEVETVDTAGGNFMGDLFTISITQRGKPTLHLFAKVANTSEPARDLVPTRLAYERELFAYTTLVGLYNDLQDKHNVPADERFQFARYYGGDLTELQECLVLENLQKKGYTMYDRRKPMNWEYAAAAIKQVARFHALSFALEAEQPQLFRELIQDSMPAMVFRKRPDNDNGFKSFHASAVKTILAALAPKYHAAVRRYCEQLETLWKDEYRPLNRPAVLLHGDYRISNLMIKYEEGSLSSLVALDFQTIFYGSGINDLLYLIFTGTDSAFRRTHYDACIELYYDSLARALAALSRDIQQVYPRHLFMQHVKEKLLYGLGVGMFILPMILVEPGTAPTISELLDDSKKKELGNNLYVERITGIVEDLVRWGALKLED